MSHDQRTFTSNTTKTMTTPTPGASFRLTFPLAGSSEPLFLLLDLAYATADQLKRLGGKARCFMTPQAVIMEGCGVAREQIEKQKQRFTAASEWMEFCAPQ